MRQEEDSKHLQSGERPLSERRTAGGRVSLKKHGKDFLSYLDEQIILELNVKCMSNGLETVLTNGLQSKEQCNGFWKSIPAALSGCPSEDDFRHYESILAYGFCHFLDRYLRVWEVMRHLVSQLILPVPRNNFSVLDIGSGPACALYAVVDFYKALSQFAVSKQLDRLAISPPHPTPIELSGNMQSFFHVLSEYTQREGPFGVLMRDFSLFEPAKQRKSAIKAEERVLNDGEDFTPFVENSEIRVWGNDLYRYQLVFLSNFLTTPSIVARFEEQLSSVFKNQQPAGVVIAIGGTGDPYDQVYSVLESTAVASGHRRVENIPEIVDDTFRRRHFSAIKEFNSKIWKHLATIADAEVFERAGYPPYWEESQPIKGLRPFAIRVFRKPTRR
jgi:hypothetical protein